MPWIKLEKPSKKRKQWLVPAYDYLTDPGKSRAPFHTEYPYAYGSPYAGTSEDKYDSGTGDKINMDPEKYIYSK
jgi:hypothetical protein